MGALYMLYLGSSDWICGLIQSVVIPGWYDKASMPKTHLHSEKNGFLDGVTAITVILSLLLKKKKKTFLGKG